VVELTKKLEDVDIIPLKNILNIKQNDISYLTDQDVNNIIDFRDEYIPGKKVSII
jgi:hypothetical protein